MASEIERNIPSVVTADLSADSVAIDDRELRERMSGNLCRCGAYNGIIEAISETLVKTPASQAQAKPQEGARP
jgi:xanthine dehydrogenase YagT iron-sulfur-binding subunit